MMIIPTPKAPHGRRCTGGDSEKDGAKRKVVRERGNA